MMACKQVDQLDITLGSALDIMHEFIPDFSSVQLVLLFWVRP